MKTFKKTGLGLLLFIMMAAGLMLASHKAMALASTSDADQCHNSMSFVDIAHIQCTIGNQKVIFTDIHPDDGTTDFEAPGGIFCGSSPHIHLTSTHGQNLTDAGDKLFGSLNVQVLKSNGVCGDTYSPDPYGKEISNSDNLKILVKGGNNGATSLDGITKGALAGLNYTRFNNGSNDSSGGFALFASGANFTDCSGTLLAVDSSNGTSAKEFKLSKNGNGLGQYPELDGLPTNTGCGVSQADFGLDESSTPRGFEISPQVSGIQVTSAGGVTTCNPSTDSNCVCSSQGCTTTSLPSPSDASVQQHTCAGLNATTFEWIFCPILDISDKITNELNKIIEQLLNFNVSDYLNKDVKSSWSVMARLASALLIIIMLLAIISQAVGGSLVDAYTLRKMLPRLVAAVVIIQLSWLLLIWLISAVNDVGHGVRALMSAPFGGWVNLDLQHLIQPFGVTGTSTLTIFTGLAVAAWWISGLTIGGAVLFAASAIASDFLAFAFLVMRQVFIVAAVILFPIAIVLWILPGTQRYWKLWYDNFIKLLMLFPIIMGLIYGGRIFAHIYIQATVSGPKSTSDINMVIGMFVLFVSFFGPYIMLPKTFKWGGQLFSAAANGAFNATKGIREAPRKLATKQMAANRAQRATDRNERLSFGEGKRFDRLFAAAGGFGLSQRATETRAARNRAEGREAGEKAVAQAITGSAYEQQTHGAKLITLDNVAAGERDDATGLDGENPALRRWALDQLATYGDWDRIDGLRAAGKIDDATWEAFVAKNISAIHQNAPHLSPIRRDMSALGAHEFTSWKDHSFHEYERQVMNGQVRTADGKGWEAHTDPTKQRSEAIRKAKEALYDDRIRAHLSTEAEAVLQRIANLDDPGASTAVSVNAPRQVDQGDRTRASLPDVTMPAGRTIAANPQAAKNLDYALASNSTAAVNSRPGVVKEIAMRLSNPNMPAVDKQGLHDYVRSFKQRAEQSQNPQFKQTYNSIVDELSGRFEKLAEQEAAKSIRPGMSETEIEAVRTEASRVAKEQFNNLVKTERLGKIA